MNTNEVLNKLIAEIERLYEIARNASYNGEVEGEMTAYDKILSFITSLQQEPPDNWDEQYQEDDLRTRFAFYTYKDEDSILYLSNVFVEETSRNKGFGTKILQAAENVAETIGAITIRLKVKRNSPANNWYRKHGYGYLTFEGEYDWLEKNLEYLKPKQGQPVPCWIHANYSDKPEIRYTPSGIPYLQNGPHMIWLSDLDTLPKNGTDLTNPIQEQPEVDLDDVIENYILENFGERWDGCVPVSCFELNMMANHFYKLGRFNARKEE